MGQGDFGGKGVEGGGRGEFSSYLPPTWQTDPGGPLVGKGGKVLGRGGGTQASAEESRVSAL